MHSDVLLTPESEGTGQFLLFCGFAVRSSFRSSFYFVLNFLKIFLFAFTHFL